MVTVRLSTALCALIVMIPLSVFAGMRYTRSQSVTSDRPDAFGSPTAPATSPAPFTQTLTIRSSAGAETFAADHLSWFAVEGPTELAVTVWEPVDRVELI